MEAGFFKWVWRFNALAIAVAIIFLLGALAWQATSSLRRGILQSQTVNEAPSLERAVTASDPTELRRYFGAPIGQVNGAPYALPLYVEREYAGRGISKGPNREMINIQVVDPQSQTGRWLFEPAARMITDVDHMYVRIDGREQSNGALLSVVEQDTNADGSLSTSDRKTVYLVGKTWNLPRKITEGVTRILRSHSVSENEIDIIFNTADGTHVARIAVQTGLIVSEKVVTPSDP